MDKKSLKVVLFDMIFIDKQHYFIYNIVRNYVG